MSVFRLDGPACDLLIRFFQARPDIYMFEVHDHGIDPLQHPDLYMEDELRESNHSDILLRVMANRGVITRPLLEHWIAEERMEEH